MRLAACHVATKTQVIFLQDDQDFVMGGWKPLKQAHALIADQGIFAENWFIHTRETELSERSLLAASCVFGQGVER